MSDISDDEYLMEIGIDEDYDFVCIRFKHKGPLKKLEDIDLVPTDWLYLNEKGILTCPFLKSMEHEEDVEMLHDLVKRKSPAPPDWPSWSVQPIGRARTYEEGVAKIEKSQTNPTIFMTDTEGGGVEAEKAIVRQIKRKKLQDENENLKKKFKASTDDNSRTSKKSTTQKKSTKNNPMPRKSSSKIQGKTIKPANGNNNASNESDSSIPSNAEDNEQSSMVASNSSAMESDGSQFRYFGVDDRGSTGKESTPKTSIGKSVDPPVTIPVINLNDVNCNNDFQRAVIYLLTGMSDRLGVLENNLKDVSKRQRDLKISLSQVIASTKNDGGDFCEKYGVQLPIKTKDAFKKFNDDLVKNVSLRRDLYAEFKSFLNNDCKVTVIMGLILRKFVSKELLSLYTAVKGSSSTSTESENGVQADETDQTDKTEKESFEPLPFCKCIYGFLRVSRKKKKNQDCYDGELRSALSGVFSNAKKWKSSGATS